METKTPSTEANWSIYSRVKRRQQIHTFNAASVATAGTWERAAAVASGFNEGIWSDYRIAPRRDILCIRTQLLARGVPSGPGSVCDLVPSRARQQAVQPYVGVLLK